MQAMINACGLLSASGSDEMVDMLSEHFFGRDSFPWDGKMKECLEAIHEMGHNVKVTYKTVP